MTERDREDIERFTEQARWLITYHDNRSESISARAVALLGFVGVILALLIGSRFIGTTDATWYVLVVGAVTIGLLLRAAYCCLMTIQGREVQAPGVEQVRKNWRDWVTGDRKGMVATDIAETFLLAKEPKKKSPIEWTMLAADTRADCFRSATRSMWWSLLSLTVLLVLVAFDTYL